MGPGWSEMRLQVAVPLGEVHESVWWAQNQEAWLPDWPQHQLAVSLLANPLPFLTCCLVCHMRGCSS